MGEKNRTGFHVRRFLDLSGLENSIDAT